MKLHPSWAATLVLALAFGLSACATPGSSKDSAQSDTAGTHTGVAASGSSSAPAAPEITAQPSPSVEATMTKAEAGKLYLRHVCPSNFSRQDMWDLIEQSYSASESGYMPNRLDLKRVKLAAAEARDITRKTIDALSDEDLKWPGKSGETVLDWTDLMYSEVAHLSSLATATDADSLLSGFTHGHADAEKTGKLAQKLRGQLGLPADAMGSCKSS